MLSERSIGIFPNLLLSRQADSNSTFFVMKTPSEKIEEEAAGVLVHAFVEA